MKLRQALPDVYQELEQGLQKAGRVELAASLESLELVDRCRCGDGFCATFFTQPKDSWPPPAELEHIVVEAPKLFCVTVASGKVAKAEYLWRPSLRQRLLELKP